MASNSQWTWVEHTAPAPAPATSTPAAPHYLEPLIHHHHYHHHHHHQPPYHYPQHQQHPQILPASAVPSYNYPIVVAAAAAAAPLDEAASAAAQPRVTDNPYPPLGSYYEDVHSAQYHPYAAEAPPPPPGAVTASSSASYYYGAGGAGAAPHVFASREVIREQISVPLGYGVGLPKPTGRPPSIPAHAISQQWKSKGLRSNSKLMKKKSLKQFTKIVQSAYCEVCKITCDTQEVLTIHKQGKKHKKKLQMLQASMAPKPTTAPVSSAGKEKHSDANKDTVSCEPPKKNLPATGEELEAKKRRVLEGGAAVGEVKVCTVCNVVVNSPKVFSFHLAGQKHAAMVKRQQELQALSSA